MSEELNELQPEEVLEEEELEEEPEEEEPEEVEVEEEAEEEEESEEESEEEESEEEEKLIDVDGEEIPLSELKQAYEQVAEARALQENTEQLLNNVVNDPGKTLFDVFTVVFQGDQQKAYKQVIDVACQIINKDMEWQGMDEKDRKAYQAQREAEMTKKQLEQYKKQEEEQKRAKEEAELASQIVNEINGALESVGLDQTDAHRATMAEAMLNAEAAGIKATPKEIAREVKKQINARQMELLKTVDPDALPPEVLQKIRKSNIKRAKSGKRAKTAKPKEQKQERTYMTESEWEERFDPFQQ